MLCPLFPGRFVTSFKEREFHKMQSLSQWMLQVYIQTYHKEKVSRPYAMHMTHFTRQRPLYQHIILKKCRDLYYKKTLSNLMEKNFLQTHGTAMGTKTAIIDQHSAKPLVWKRYIDDVFSLWDTNREEINNFIEHANNYHPTIKFTADISDKETIFLDTCI